MHIPIHDPITSTKRSVNLPANLDEIVCPLNKHRWEQELKSHPDQEFAEYRVAGISYGFRVGFNRSASRLRDSTNNVLSAMEHPHVVDEYLAQELALKRMGVVPLVVLSTTQCHISPFGVIPKKSKPGKWRLIVDLSSPQGMMVSIKIRAA